MPGFFKKNWNDYYKKIESAEKEYRHYKYDDEHNVKLIQEWSQQLSKARYYLNEEITKHGTSHVTKAREDFIKHQAELIAKAFQAANPGYNGFYGKALKSSIGW